MTMKFETLLALSPPKELFALVRLMTIVNDSQEYEKLVRMQLGVMGNFAEREQLLIHGHFSSMDLMQLLMGCGCPQGVSMQTVMTLLAKLGEWALVSKVDIPNAFAPYMWNKKHIAVFAGLKILDNVLLGPSYIAQKYRQSVPSIVVLKNGRERIGTGFVVESVDKTGALFILTAKHNIDPADGIEFRQFGMSDDMQYDPVGADWHLHPVRDIAAIQVRAREMPPSQRPVAISLRGWAHVLSRTVTLGYPTISSTDQAYLLAHGGELNAIVTSYMDKQRYLLISNTVAPGNSGGPVLDEAGLCVGMVVQALEGEYEGGVSKASAAIPSNELLAFVESIR